VDVIMTMHHIVKEAEGKLNCMYCGADLTKKQWTSNFHGHMHYKIMKCSCGKNSKVRVTYGSGHDSWDGSKTWSGVQHCCDKKLEAKIKEIEYFKELERVDSFKK
jgi:hypothetical protein